MNTRIITGACLALIALFLSSAASAHALNQGYIFLSLGEQPLSGRVEMTLADVNVALGLDLPSDGSATLADIEPHVDRIIDYVDARIELAEGGQTAPLTFGGPTLFATSFAHFIQIPFEAPSLSAEPDALDVLYGRLFDAKSDHRGMLVVENNWKTGTLQEEANVLLVFEPGSERQVLDLSSSSWLRGFANMIGLGTHHIWVGIDHILFLFALLLPAVVIRRDGAWRPVGGFRPALIHVIKVVTIFTVAHTITLSLAALNAVSLPSRLVESIIAISIAIAALDIFIPILRERIWVIVFAFGLFHGFGFASVLSEIGIPSSYVVPSLLGFNVGVELGQVAIVVVIFPLLYLVRQHFTYTRLLLPASAAGLIVVSLYWFTERAFLIDLPAGAIVNKVFGLGA